MFQILEEEAGWGSLKENKYRNLRLKGTAGGGG